MATVKDVAVRAGVSLGSVSNYLNGKKLKKDTYERIKKAIDELDFHQNIMAQGLKHNKSMSIGVVINSLTDFFAMSIVSAIENYVENYGYSIIICDYREDLERFEQKISFLMKRSIDAIVVFHHDDSSPMLKAASKKIPIIAIDAPIKGIETDTILVNNYESSKQGVERLIKLGFKNIGIISGQKKNYISRERQGGYENALKENNIKINKKLIWSGNYTIKSGYDGVIKLLSENNQIDALFVINYYMSLGALNALKEKFKDRRIEILVFDHFFVNDVFYPTIKSIEQPVESIGNEAGKILMERMINNKKGDYRTIYCKNKLINF